MEHFPPEAPPDQGASSCIYPPTQENLDFFADRLRRGHLVAVPTETVYGLAALATDEEACRRIFAVKGRPLLDPLIVHVDGTARIPEIALPVEGLEELARKFWPGPLTVILPKRERIPDLITSGKPSVAVRVPRHETTLALLGKVNGPLAAPSANPFGYVSPTRAEHVAAAFGRRVPYIVDGGPCQIGLESTILDLRNPKRPALLRPGAIGLDALQSCLGRSITCPENSVQPGQAALAPGTLQRHYSPRTPLHLFTGAPALESLGDGSQAVVFLRPPADRNRPEESRMHFFWWSESGEFAEIARNLFALLRTLDDRKFTAIHCQLPQGDAPLAIALRDRLHRAAAKT